MTLPIERARDLNSGANVVPNNCRTEESSRSGVVVSGQQEECSRGTKGCTTAYLSPDAIGLEVPWKCKGSRTLEVITEIGRG